MQITNDNGGIVPPWLRDIDLWPLPTHPDYPHNGLVPPKAFIPDDEFTYREGENNEAIRGQRSING